MGTKIATIVITVLCVLGIKFLIKWRLNEGEVLMRFWLLVGVMVLAALAGLSFSSVFIKG